MLDAAQSVKLPLQEALADYERAGVKTSVRVLDASVPEGIRRTAMEEAADLVVVGRGRVKGALARLWSPLYTIIRESPCPVLSV
jgi:nucleotide-binding universal stress UspA family protein